MKTLILIATLLLSSMAYSKTVVVMGQSNAWGIVQHGALNAEVIDCTHRGQNIKKFQLNFSRKSFFGQCLEKAKGKKVDALVFWQGESDTVTTDRAIEWPYLASRLIRDIQTYVPGLPVIMVALHDGYPAQEVFNRWGWAYVREQQMNFMGVTVIDSSTYEFEPTHLHLTNAGYYEISLTINEYLK